MVNQKEAENLRALGMQYKDIAEKLGCSVGWCKANLKHVFVTSKKGSLVSGAKYITRLNGGLIVVEDRGWDSVAVQFIGTGTEVIARRADVVAGIVKDYYKPSVFGVGFVGVGAFRHTESDGVTPTRYSVAWRGMLRRCYDANFQRKRLTYSECTVDPKWHNFQEFALWAAGQAFEPGWEIDKDILVQFNKHYSPETCCFVPQRVNTLLTHIKCTNGELPFGVQRDVTGTLFHAYCHDGSAQVYAGTSKTPEGAFELYVLAKEAMFKAVADEHKDSLEVGVYEALYNRKVTING